MFNAGVVQEDVDGDQQDPFVLLQRSTTSVIDVSFLVCGYTNVRVFSLRHSLSGAQWTALLFTPLWVLAIELWSVDLHGTHIMASLASVVQPRSITSLLLDDCKIGRESLPMLLSALAFNSRDSLSRLDFTCNDFSNVDWDEFVRALSSFRNLKGLDLSMCFIGRTGCNALARLLRRRDSNLAWLSLDNSARERSYTGDSDDDSMIYDHGTRENPTSIPIDDVSITTIAGALTNNTKLVKLGLEDNGGITGDGWRTMSRLVCDTSSIEAVVNSNHTLFSVIDPEVEDTIVSNTFNADDNDFFVACLNMNRSLRNNGTSRNMVIKDKLIWAHLKAPLKVAGGKGEMPNFVICKMLAWFANESLLAQFPPPDNNANLDTSTIGLDAIYRFIGETPSLFQRSPEPTQNRVFHWMRRLFCPVFHLLFSIVWFTIKVPIMIGLFLFKFWFLVVTLRILWLFLADDNGAWEMGAGVDYEYNMPGIY